MKDYVDNLKLEFIKECKNLVEVQELCRDADERGERWYRLTPLVGCKDKRYLLEIFRED